MAENEPVRGLDAMPPPRPRHKALWKKPFVWIFGAIGVMASTTTVVGVFQGWFAPEPTAKDLAAASNQKLEKIERKLDAKEEDTQLVNQVSRRVTELGDQYKRLQARMEDIRRLDRSLSNQARPARILTPDQKKLEEASRRKETEELLALIESTEKSAKTFLDSVHRDDTLGKVQSAASDTARTKQRALEQARQVENSILPALGELRGKHAGGK